MELVITSLVFALLSQSTFAKSFISAQRHKAEVRVFEPIPASVFSDYEGRGSSSIPVSNYVMHGLSGETRMVSRDYALRNSESFYWGPNDTPMANLTAYANDENTRVLSLERFLDTLHTADCSNNDTIKLTFKNDIQLDHVEEAWSWVNNRQGNHIIFVTNNAHCNIPDGDLTIRQAWHVLGADFDTKNNVVTLSAKPKTWEEALTSWHLRVSSKGLQAWNQTQSKSLGKRDWTPSISLEANFPSTAVPLEDDDGDSLGTIACSPCYSTGSLDFDIDIWIPLEFWEGLQGYVTLTPNDVGADITMALSLSEEITESLIANENLFDWVPEDVGVYIPGILDVGPTFKVDLIAGITAATASVDLTTGIQMSLPADAWARLDFSDSSENEWLDWAPVFTPQLPYVSESISISAEAGVQLRLELDGEALGYGIMAGLALAAPTLDITLEAMSSPEGQVCGNPAADFGVSFDAGIGAELDAFAGVGAATALPNSIAIFSTSYDLFSTCITIGPGSPTPAPTTTTTTIPPYPIAGNSTTTTIPTATG